MYEENVENIDPEEDTPKDKNKRKVLRKIKRKKSKKVCDETKDDDGLQNFQECSLAKRKSLSLEVEKMSQGKQLSHFQAMAMLRKALVASFIATPGNSNKGIMEMKSTENRRKSDDGEIAKGIEETEEETVPVEQVKCLVLKDDMENETEESSKEKQATDAVKLVSKVAGKTSRWKVVEKEFVQGKDVSKYDAWKLILLSDLFPKGTTAFEDIANDEETSEDDEDEDDEHETTLTDEEEEEVAIV